MKKTLIEKIGELVAENEQYHQITGDQTLYDEFIAQYPVESLSELTLQDYCLGYGSKEKNFCWWLERGLQPVLGRYSPGTARGHLIYLLQDGTYYKHRRLKDLSDEEAMQYMAKIHHVIASTSPDDIGWLDSDDEIYRRANVEPRVTMGPGRVLRVLNMYHPAHMPIISSSDHLKHFLEKLGETNIPPQPMERLELYLQHYQSVKDQFDGKLTTRGFAVALYSEEIGVQPPPRQSKSSAGDGVDGGVLPELEETSESQAQNQILYGPPGTGKTLSLIHI